jgi:integrase/recombinase XerD
LTLCHMRTLYEQFVRERKYLKNVTPKTEAWYWQSWQALAGALPEDAAVPPSKAYWTDRIAELRDKGVSAVSVNTYARAINAFLKWAHDEGHVPARVRIPRLKEEKFLLATLTSSHVDHLLRWKPKSASANRVHTLACLLLDTGVRANEALSLRRSDVDLDNLLIRVKGKGQKDRVVPMSFELRRILYRWTTKHTFDLVFPTARGTKQGQRNALRDFQLMGRALGISGVRFSFHTMRHTFAVNYIRNGGDVFRLQRVLGHATLEMTRRYVNLQTEDLKAVHDRLSLLTARG